MLVTVLLVLVVTGSCYAQESALRAAEVGVDYLQVQPMTMMMTMMMMMTRRRRRRTISIIMETHDVDNHQ
jgi:hypothetical protein